MAAAAADASASSASSSEDATCKILTHLPLEGCLTEIAAHVPACDLGQLACASTTMKSAVELRRSATKVADTVSLGTPLHLALRGLCNLRELHLRHDASPASPPPPLTDGALAACVISRPGAAPQAPLRVLEVRVITYSK